MFLLDWINTDEVLSLIVLICLLHFIGGQIARTNAEAYRRARQVFPAALLLYVAMGMYACGVESVTDVLVIFVKAILAASAVFGIATILFPAIAFVYQELALMKKVEIAKPDVIWHEPEEPLREEPPVEQPVPSLSQKEQADEARRRFGSKIAMLDNMQLDEMELKSAKEKAKKQYLKEIDDLLK